MNTTAPVIALDTHAALDAARVGRKAADLAAARAAGLPVAPGVVLTADWSPTDTATAEQVWRITSLDGARLLVTRPSPVDDACRAHGALAAVTIARDPAEMLASIAELRADDPRLPILVQAHVPGTWRGELFADDASGHRRSRSLVTAVAANGDEWVGELDHGGRVRDVLTSGRTPAPDAVLLARVQRLSSKVADVFDGPRDLEWVATPDGRVQLLRARRLAVLAPCVPARRELVGAAA